MSYDSSISKVIDRTYVSEVGMLGAFQDSFHLPHYLAMLNQRRHGLRH